MNIDNYNKTLNTLNAYHREKFNVENEEAIRKFANTTFKSLIEIANELSSFQNFGKPFRRDIRQLVVKYAPYISLEYYEQFLEILSGPGKFLMSREQILYKMLLCAIERNEVSAYKPIMEKYAKETGSLLQKLVMELNLISKSMPHQIKKREQVIEILTQFEGIQLDPARMSHGLYSELIRHNFNFNSPSAFTVNHLKHAFKTFDYTLLMMLYPHFTDHRFLIEPVVDEDVLNYFSKVHHITDIVRIIDLLMSWGFRFNQSTEEYFKIALKLKDHISAGRIWLTSNSNPDISINPDVCENEVTLLELKLVVSPDTEFIRRLLEKKVNLNIVMSNGETPLGYIIKRGFWNIYGNVFLKAGANIHFADKQKKTAVAHAFDQENLELMDLLFNAGATQFDYRNQNGDSYFSWALRNRKNAFLDQLLTVFKCPVDIKNSRGETLLYLAFRARAEDLIKKLLEMRADVNARANDGTGVIHVAIKSGLENYLMSIQPRINLYFQSEAGISPLTQARNCNVACYKKMSRLLFPDLPVLIKEANEFKQFITAAKFTPEQIDQIFDLAIQLRSPVLLLDFAKALNNPGQLVDAFTSYLYKRPQIEKAFWISTFLQRDMRHTAITVDESDVPEASNNVDINDLNTMFQQINTTQREAPGYVSLEIMTRNGTMEQLKLGLSAYIQAVIRKTPERSIVNPKVYYKNLHNLLRHITLFCRNMDPKERAYVLKDLAEASFFCSTRRYNQPLELYYCYSQKKPDRSLPTLFYRQLSQLRLNIVNLMAESDVHHITRIVKVIGKMVNVPGLKIFEDFKDGYRVVEQDRAVVEKDFLNFYNSYKLYHFAIGFIKEQLREELLQEEENSTVLSWFKSTVPANFKGGKFAALKEKKEQYDLGLKRRLENQQITPEKYELAKKKLFEMHEITMANDTETFAYAVAREEKESFLSEVVFEEDFQTLKVSGVLHFLQQMGVVDNSASEFIMLVEKKLQALDEQQGKKARR